MSDPSASSGSSILPALNVLLTTVITIGGAYFGWRLNAADAALKEVQASVTRLEEARKDRESLEEKQIKVYDLVVASLEKDDQRRQKVAAALVTSLLDDPLRTEMLNVLRESGTPEVKVEVARTIELEQQFKVEQKAAEPERAKASFNWEDFDYDLFWCERSGEAAQKTAEQIQAQLRAEGAKGRLRVRLLPDSINARPGYQHSGYVIRYNGKEQAQAEALQRAAKGVTGADFKLSLSGQDTPWYLSAFVCP